MPKGFMKCPDCQGKGCATCNGSGLVPISLYASETGELEWRTRLRFDPSAIRPAKAFWLNMIPVPIGLGWLYLGEGWRALLSGVFRVVGFIMSFVIAIWIDSARGCPISLTGGLPDYCYDRGLFQVLLLVVIVAVNLLVLVISAGHAYLFARDRIREFESETSNPPR